MEKRVKVFISYSWDGPEHEQWVLNLANTLRDPYGIDVILDQFDLEIGSDLTYFMEQSIEQADKVIIVLTPNYKARAEKRSNGVGYETSMISQEIFQNHITNIKFLPILRNGNAETSAPKYLKTKKYHNMLDDSKFTYDVLQLARAISGTETVKKSPLAPIPDFNSLSQDPLLAQIQSLKSEEKLNKEIDEFINSENGLSSAKESIQDLFEIIHSKVKLYSTAGMNFSTQYEPLRYFSVVTSGFSAVVKVLNRLERIEPIHLRTEFYRVVPERDKYSPAIINVLQPISTCNYVFDLDKNKYPVWKSSYEALNIVQLTEQIFTFLIEHAKNVIAKGLRKH